MGDGALPGVVVLADLGRRQGPLAGAGDVGQRQPGLVAGEDRMDIGRELLGQAAGVFRRARDAIRVPNRGGHGHIELRQRALQEGAGLFEFLLRIRAIKLHLGRQSSTPRYGFPNGQPVSYPIALGTMKQDYIRSGVGIARIRSPFSIVVAKAFARISLYASPSLPSTCSLA